MRIWVDADACPVAVREILFRAARRTAVPVTLVADRPLRAPASPYIDTLQVAAGVDAADHEIARRTAAGDIVVTADIPLAAEVIERGAHALSPRGELFSAETIRGRLTMRDFLDTLRGSGVMTGGPRALGPADRRAFAGHLDRLLAGASGG